MAGIQGEEMSPASLVISLFGGVREMSRALDGKRSPSSISKWQRPLKAGGSGGKIPTHAQCLILDAAKKHKIPLTPEDLIYGRTSRR